MFRKGDSAPDVGITRRHWMPAAAVKDCCNPACGRRLSYSRKHHCRCCGNVFCTDCTDYSLPLDPSTGQILTSGVWAKVCILCYELGIEDGFEQPEVSDASDASDGEADRTPSPDSLEAAVLRRRPGFVKGLSANKQGSTSSSSTASGRETEPEKGQGQTPERTGSSGAGTPGTGPARAGAARGGASERAGLDAGQGQSTEPSTVPAGDGVPGQSGDIRNGTDTLQHAAGDTDVLLVLEGAKSILERGAAEVLRTGIPRDGALESFSLKTASVSVICSAEQNSEAESAALNTSELDVVFEEAERVPNLVKDGTKEGQSGTTQQRAASLSTKGGSVTGPRFTPYRSSPLSGFVPQKNHQFLPKLPGADKCPPPPQTAQAQQNMAANPQSAEVEASPEKSVKGPRSHGSGSKGSGGKGSGLRARRVKKIEELPVSVGMPIGLWNSTPEKNLPSPASVLDRPMERSPFTGADASAGHVDASDGDSTITSLPSTSYGSEWDGRSDPSRSMSMRSQSILSDESAGPGPGDRGHPFGHNPHLGSSRQRSFGGEMAEPGSMMRGPSRKFPNVGEMPWEPKVSDRLRELHDLWEQRIRKKFASPVGQSKGSKLNIRGLQKKSDGSPRKLAVPPAAPIDVPRQKLFSSPSWYYRSRTISPRVVEAHKSFAAQEDEHAAMYPPSFGRPKPVAAAAVKAANKDPGGSPADEDVPEDAQEGAIENVPEDAAMLRLRSDSADQGETLLRDKSVSESVPEADALQQPEPSSGAVELEDLDDRAVVEESKPTADAPSPGQARDRVSGATQSSDGRKEEGAPAPAGGAEAGVGEKREGAGGVTRWSVEDVCNWLQKDVPFQSGKAKEYAAAFEKAGLGGLRLLGLHRDDPACADMSEQDWAVFKMARWRLLATNLDREAPELAIAIPEAKPIFGPELDEAPNVMSPMTEDATYSPRSPELSDTALFSPMKPVNGQTVSVESDGNTNWLWKLVAPHVRNEESNLQAAAIMMEVQTLRREIVASEEREVTMRAQLSHLDEVLESAQLAEYLSTRTRWSPLPGEIPVPDLDVDDWLPRFVVLQGTTLAFFLKATDVRPQATVNLRGAVEVGPLAPSEHSAGNADGQSRAFYVLTEHGMRMECSTRNRLKFELWLSSVVEARDRSTAGKKSLTPAKG